MTNKIQIHATNINGLGAKNVAKELINHILKTNYNKVDKVIIGDKNLISQEDEKIIPFNRILPRTISRLFEILFSKFYFKNIPTLVLGDIPLSGIKNQILFVHQANLVDPSINPYSSDDLRFRVLRFLFKKNLKYVDRVIVQSDFMKDELIKSYPQIKFNIEVYPLPTFYSQEFNIVDVTKNKIKLLYPALGYKHKNHNFLLDLDKICKKHDLEIYVTLDHDKFKKYSRLKFLKNLGVINHSEVLKFYNKVDALLNLSNIESFCLPLVESIEKNLAILTIDRNYSRWMCADYAYYFKDLDSFEKKIIELKSDLKNGKKKSSKKAMSKFIYSWDEIANFIINKN